MLFYLVARDYVLSTQDSLFFSPVALIVARFDVECHIVQLRAEKMRIDWWVCAMSFHFLRLC